MLRKVRVGSHYRGTPIFLGFFNQRLKVRLFAEQVKQRITQVFEVNIYSDFWLRVSHNTGHYIAAISHQTTCDKIQPVKSANPNPAGREGKPFSLYPHTLDEVVQKM